MPKLQPLRSPITGGNRVRRVLSVEREALRRLYMDNYGFDISSYMPEGMARVELFECMDSRFRFWWPNTIVGDGQFYAKLQEQEWYYMPEKWEFREALRHVPAAGGVALLEIGSGRGDFLEIIKAEIPSAHLVGLELNEEAAVQAQGRGLNVLIEGSGKHSESHPETYDVVASFQVLEHVPDPIAVLADAVQMLKPGGTLIIAVPDNSRRAFPSIIVKPDADLNMPPHHQGHWAIPSLAYLIKVLPLRLEYMAVEPAIASHHRNNYRGLMKFDLLGRFGRALGMLIYLLGRPFYDHAMRHLGKYLPAHTILAVYTKVPNE